jgi:DNA polymerase-3 subunit delta
MAKRKGLGYEELRKAIEAKEFRPVYLLHGEEPWFIDELVKLFEKHTLEEHERDFNQQIFYGKDSSAEQIVNAAKRFPMMAERQLVIVKEAQELDAWRREADRDHLEGYFKQAQPTTVLVIAHKYKKLAGNTKVYKALAEAGEVFESNKLDERNLPGWVKERGNALGIELHDSVVQILGEYLGSELGKLIHAIEKLQFMVGKGNVVTPADVEKYIGISKDYNIFELQDAIAQKDVMKTHRIINYFEANPKQNSIYMVVGFLHAFASKLMIYHDLQDKSNRSAASALGLPWFALDGYRAAAANYPQQKVARWFKLLRDCDRKIKGVRYTQTQPGELMRELVLRMMN